MSHAEVQADLTGERRGAAVSFATKEEAIAYIVSHAPRGTSLFDIAVVESGLTDVDEADLLEPLPRAAYKPWIVPLTARPNDAASDTADD
ncbi:MAG TPA: hypothetical protein VGY54_26265 [Polyangiaceae bacterium]|jgi:hypothetical protein|nr:hypothetical protein [Polyangiaceae bacterium]